MKSVMLAEKHIAGLSVRTNNANERHPETAKIAGLHQTFVQQAKVKYEKGACLYGVYYQYESDHRGDFSVLVGAEPDMLESNAELTKTLLPAGDYLVFSGEGEMPQVVIAVWEKIWRYFADDTCVHTRAYSVDFECYTSETKVDIYIAIA